MTHQKETKLSFTHHTLSSLSKFPNYQFIQLLRLWTIRSQALGDFRGCHRPWELWAGVPAIQVWCYHMSVMPVHHSQTQFLCSDFKDDRNNCMWTMAAWSLLTQSPNHSTETQWWKQTRHFVAEPPAERQGHYCGLEATTIWGHRLSGRSLPLHSVQRWPQAGGRPDAEGTQVGLLLRAKLQPF